MTAFIVRRLLAIIVLIIVTILVFFAMRLPGDPILMLVTTEEFDQGESGSNRRAAGETRTGQACMCSMPHGWEIIRGDTGRSILRRTPVM